MIIVPTLIKDAASIQKSFLNLRTMVHFTQNRPLMYSRNRQNFVKHTNFRSLWWVRLLFKSVLYWGEYGTYFMKFESMFDEMLGDEDSAFGNIFKKNYEISLLGKQNLANDWQ